jgi:hypothetical protein
MRALRQLMPADDGLVGKHDAVPQVASLLEDFVVGEFNFRRIRLDDLKAVRKFKPRPFPRRQRLFQPPQPALAGAHSRSQHHVSREARLLGVAVRRNPCIGDARLLEQGIAHLAKLHAVPAQLHLVVGAIEVKQFAVPKLAHTVARAIHAFTGTEGIGNKPLLRELLTIQVAAREAVAADQQLACHAWRNQVKAFVDDIDLRRRDRPADRTYRTGRILDVQLAPRNVHARLRNAVHVDEPNGGIGSHPIFQLDRIEPLAAEDDPSKR